MFLFLLFLKIDFRFAENIYCCGDDHDYFLHAETIAIDGDLDYSNQLKGLEDRRFNKNGKIAPIGFIGSGILSAPFLFIGNLLDNFFGNEGLMNYKILLYSFAPIFYYFLTYKLIISSFKILKVSFKKLDLFLILTGSGVIYYAFERFSMTHVYEVFTGTLIFYFCAKYYSSISIDNKSAFLIPISILLGILVRWVNYYFLFIPLIFQYLYKKKINNNFPLTRNKYFYFSFFASILTFLLHSKTLYGRYTFDPRFVYNSGLSISNLGSNVISERTSFLANYFENIRIIIFSQEFGSLYFTPIIPVSLIMVTYYILKNAHYRKIIPLILMLCYFQVFSIYYVWQSSGSSYGLRYLYSLIPLSVFAYYGIKEDVKISFVHNTLLFLSLFSILSVLFFETTESTQLSLSNVTNSWGQGSRYAQRNYLSGVLESFITLEAYLKIFTTSFLGAIVFKILIFSLSISSVNKILLDLGLPVGNDDFQIYLLQLDQIGIDKFILVILIGVLLVRFFYKKV